MSTEKTKNPRQLAAEAFTKQRDECVELLEEYGRLSAVQSDEKASEKDRVNAAKALADMADELEGAYRFYKHQCEHRSKLGRNPHTDTELGELKHEKGLAWKAWQAALSHRPAPPTDEQILQRAKEAEAREKEAKAILRKDKEERKKREQEEFERRQ